MEVEEIGPLARGIGASPAPRETFSKRVAAESRTSLLLRGSCACYFFFSLAEGGLENACVCIYAVHVSVLPKEVAVQEKLPFHIGDTRILHPAAVSM